MAKWGVVVLVALCAACGGSEPAPQDSGPTSSVRDSAGVEIVESSRPRWTEGEVWSLSRRPLFTIQASDGRQRDRLLDPVTIDVDSRGRILIGDGNQVGWDAILVYDSLGQFLFKAGEPGDGPGEFGQLMWASAYRGDSIAGFNAFGNTGIHVYDPSGRYVRHVPVPPLIIPRRRGVPNFTDGIEAAYRDGHFLAYPDGPLDIPARAGPTWWRHLLLRVSPSGESWDTLGTFEMHERYWDGARPQSLWFGAVALTEVGSDELYFGRGKSFEIERYDASGRLTRILRRAFTPRRVTQEDKDAVAEFRLRPTRPSPEDEGLPSNRPPPPPPRFAEAIPPYSDMVLDDEGNLWVAEFTCHVTGCGSPARFRNAFGERSLWSVFDPAGIWLGDVETPRGFVLRDVTRDRALGFRVDELGVSEVDVYRLERPTP